MQYPAATELALLSACPYSSRVFGDGGFSRNASFISLGANIAGCAAYYPVLWSLILIPFATGPCAGSSLTNLCFVKPT